MHSYYLVGFYRSRDDFGFCNKHLLDETESKIRFVLPGKVMLDEAKLSLISLDPAKLI